MSRPGEEIAARLRGKLERDPSREWFVLHADDVRELLERGEDRPSIEEMQQAVIDGRKLLEQTWEREWPTARTAWPAATVNGRMVLVPVVIMIHPGAERYESPADPRAVRPPWLHGGEGGA